METCKRGQAPGEVVSPCYWKKVFGQGLDDSWWGVVEGFLALSADWTRSEISKLDPLVNKDLLEHNHNYSYIYECFYVTMAEDSGETESKIFTIWPFMENFCQLLDRMTLQVPPSPEWHCDMAFEKYFAF